MYSAKIICDSISETVKRLTTFEITFPRMVLAEFNTHGAFSRNSASSRAIPFSKMLDRIMDDPFIPEKFPINIAGMQPAGYYESPSQEFIESRSLWLSARNKMVNVAKELSNRKIHKQICNRLLEPFMWHTCIISATEWDNFFKLRCDSNAQYEIKRIADLMYEVYHSKENRIYYPPKQLRIGEWHLPFISNEDERAITDYLSQWLGKIDVNDLLYEELEIKKRISIARCAQISYLTHDRKRDIEKDLELFERLKMSGHWSPFEHVATPYWTKPKLPNDNIFYTDLRSGNFIGWKQFRKEFQGENCTNFRKQE